jgi:hypothetical protein
MEAEAMLKQQAWLAGTRQPTPEIAIRQPRKPFYG